MLIDNAISVDRVCVGVCVCVAGHACSVVRAGVSRSLLPSFTTAARQFMGI